MRSREHRGAEADLLAAGLGNPTVQYAHTRHNAGADAIALLAERHDTGLRRERGTESRCGEVHVADKRLILAIPETYMNESGIALRPLCKRYGISDWNRLVIVHDELDLPLGTVRIKVGGGIAGHNGLRSIESQLHTRDFVRVRIGIGRPPGTMSGADYVLRRPPRAEQELFSLGLQLAADAVEAVLADGPNGAMNTLHGR
jgi:PTH1 family peptidyl-tRNA hydrolase